MLTFITPNWPAPPWVKAVSTTRKGGFSKSPFNSLNLSWTVGDNPEDVARNWGLLTNSLKLAQELPQLTQVHGNKVISVDDALPSEIVADAVYSKRPDTVCMIRTADCLPLLICGRRRHCVAAIHAGWKGLAAGVIEETIGALNHPTEDLLAWLGPAIGPDHFIVGEEVVELLVEKDPGARSTFQPLPKQRWRANLYQLARRRLDLLGVKAVYGGDHCTYTEEENFFSFRREKITGRMASLIWIGDILPA